MRLNPNIPYKTRGNGALAVGFGRGYGSRHIIGNIDGMDVHGYSRIRSLELDDDTWEKIVDAVDSLRMHDHGTESFLLLTWKKLPVKYYREALHRHIRPEDVDLRHEAIAAYRSFAPEARGKIGATAALGWQPKRYTYELIAYRYPERIGTKRDIDPQSVIEMDEEIESTFDNYDRKNDYVAIAPNSPCPVLFGIRGTIPEDLIKAKDMICGEGWSRWMIYRTNQGTDDHIERIHVKNVRPWMSVAITGTVAHEPKTIPGGHVIFRICDNTGCIDCAAYEPTKEFRDIVRALVPGDVIEVYGGVRKEPMTVNIEKMRVIKLARYMKRVPNIRCPRCGGSMKSHGKNEVICRRCGYKLRGSKIPMVEVDRKIKPGWYEVPVIARRHLAMPLKLIYRHGKKS